jgi:lipopolysaccharide biosynthesis regulator YciM
MANDSKHKKQLEKAKKLLYKGVDGDKKAVKSANQELLKLRESETDNALIEAYYGSSLALLARDAVKPLEKADKAQEGLDALNRAVTLDPNQKEIRLLRANVCLRLPESFFHCSSTAIEDFSFLLNRYQENPSYLTQKQVGEILRNLSTACQNAGKPDEANTFLQRLTQNEIKKNERKDSIDKPKPKDH